MRAIRLLAAISGSDFSALQAALELKEAAGRETAGEIFITAFCADKEETAVPALRRALALGCRRAVLAPGSSAAAERSRALARAFCLEKADLLLSAGGPPDFDAAAAGAAEILSLPFLDRVGPISLSGGRDLLVRPISLSSSFSRKLPLPCAVSVLPERPPRFFVTAGGLIRSFQRELTRLDEPAAEKRAGNALPRPARFSPQRFASPEAAAAAILDLLSKNRLLPERPNGAPQADLISDFGPFAGGLLPGARILVSGGRGVCRPDCWELLWQTAAALDGELAGSRAAVEAGCLPAFCQVGQSGRTVSPLCYLACGISGAVQHLSGMRASRLIISINPNPSVPIFSVSHLGIIGRAEEILPALIKALPSQPPCDAARALNPLQQLF